MTRAFTFVVALAIPSLAAAQASPADEISDVRSEARGHIGPFYITPSVLVKEVGIDSNVFNEAGDQKSDFTVTVAPKLNTWVPMSRRALVKSTLASDLVWYSQYATERSVNPQLSVGGELYARRITVFGDRAHLSTRQRPNHELDLRSRHTEDAVTAGVRVALTPTVSVEAAARQVEIRYDTDAEFDGTSLQRTLNRETRGVQLTGRYRVTPLTALAVRAEVHRDEFQFSPERDSESYRVMPGVEFEPKALLKGSAYVGYRKFTPRMPEALPEFSGLVGELGLSYTLLGSTTFGVRYRRDLTYSYSELQPFFVDNSVGASIRRALGGRFDALASADRHEYAYRHALEIVPVPAPRLDVTWNYSASVGYRIGRDGRLGFGVAYVQRESTYQLRAYDNLRIGSTFSYGF